jgi:hypothetical protein
MNRLIDHLINLLRGKPWDRANVTAEVRHLSSVLMRQVFNQIPGVSGVAALMVGGWVASTYTTSPWKAALAQWGLISGGKHLVSSGTYRFMSVVLPIVVGAITAYVVQKRLKAFRERQMERDIALVARLGNEVPAVVEKKLAILEQAREAGLLSPSEYLTKKANLYATYSQVIPTRVKELLISKIAG